MTVFSKETFTFDRVIRIAITIAIVWGLVWVLGYLSDVLIPFVAALLLAYLINPLVNFFQYKVRVKVRVLSVIISLLLLIIVLVSIGWFVIPIIGKELGHMGDLLSKLANDIHFERKASEYFPEGVVSYVKEMIGSDKCSAKWQQSSNNPCF